MIRRAFLAGAAAALLAGCVEGDPVHFDHMVKITEENAANMVGRWEGRFWPRDGEGEEGVAVMEVREVDGTLVRGRMTWMRDGAVWHEEDFVAALTRNGHYMFLHTHAMVHRRADEHYIMADVLMKDGKVYMHHLSRSDVSFGDA